MEHTEHPEHQTPQPTPTLPRARRRGARTHRWRRDSVELAAVFVSVTAADLVAKIVVNGPDGPVVLAASALVLLATALFHTWWSQRHHPHAPAPPTTLWRVRTAARSSPADLARVHTALADRHVAILSLQPHPLPDTTVDELYLRAPHTLSPTDLTALLTTTGHPLLDTPTRIG
ncbi:hypothetical protein P3T27_005265 [Kitasatospora sp. MAA19]|uniref:hypothetical protein n=1 Tax=Kitasatospora sp. MAA19 TaxID=3035090 RepID=UPI00247C663E|nr:hypothetical protein [Kitasatospora sp. MAA19]